MENSKIPLKPSLANNNYLDTTFHCTIIMTQTDILGEKSYWLGEWWPVGLYCLPQSHSISSEVGLVFSTKDSDLGLTIIERKKRVRHSRPEGGTSIVHTKSSKHTKQ